MARQDEQANAYWVTSDCEVTSECENFLPIFILRAMDCTPEWVLIGHELVKPDIARSAVTQVTTCANNMNYWDLSEREDASR